MDIIGKEKQVTEILEQVLDESKKAGATHAEVSASINEDLTRTHRNRQVESHERGESQSICLRVFVDNRPAVTSGNLWDKESITNLAERAVSMAKNIPNDKDSIPAEREEVKKGNHENFDCFDSYELSESKLEKSISIMEDAALSPKGVKAVEQASGSLNTGVGGIAFSNGFIGVRPFSRFSYSIVAMAQQDSDRQIGWDYDEKIYYNDLEDTELIGSKAGIEAVKRLGGRKLASQEIAIIFDKEISSSILGEFISAINGYTVSKGLSFLTKSMGKNIFNDKVTIEDMPHIKRGLGSRSYDAEGIPTRNISLVENGELKNWLLDLRSSRRLGLKHQGNAVGSYSRSPSPGSSNLFMKAGDITPKQLYSQFDKAILVQEIMGTGGNTINGDYSIGISGQLLEKGEMICPVQEVTIASTLPEIFKACIPCNDIYRKGSTHAPTMFVGRMTMGGRSN